jgi:hypothetical protein
MVRTELTQSLIRRLTRGDYEVDAQAVAEAILDRTSGNAELPFASGVLVATERGRLSAGRDQHDSSTGADLA